MCVFVARRKRTKKRGDSSINTSSQPAILLFHPSPKRPPPIGLMCATWSVGALACASESICVVWGRGNEGSKNEPPPGGPQPGALRPRDLPKDPPDGYRPARRGSKRCGRRRSNTTYRLVLQNSA